MDAILRIHTLGGLTIQLGEKPIEKLGTRKAEALLVYLAGTGRSQARDVLAELLWEDRSQSQAQANLRVALSGLRKGLGNHLLISRESVALDQEKTIYYDVGKLEADLESANRDGGIQTRRAKEIAAGALELYRGEFLEGFYVKQARGFNEWLLQERERLLRLVIGGLHDLVAYELLCGDYTAGLGHCERLLSMDPLMESGHRQMMQLLAYSGRRAQALAQYETCRQLLWSELGIDPSAATQSLYEKLRRGGLVRRGDALRQIRGYDLLEQIGSGEYGAVYRAYQPSVDREVAVKVILPHYANDPDFIRRFETEAQVVARLEHPHIVPLYDYWREPDGAYLVMRLFKGGSLENLLEKGPLGLEQAVELFEQVTAGLAAAHQQGVVHRDIKPANILLDEAGRAYLTDFGIAKVLDQSLAKTRSGELLGSPLYSSPEQLRNEPVTPQADIYSLGILLYQLLTGKTPFDGTSLADLVERQLTAPIPLIGNEIPEYPSGVDQVIQRATVKDPDGRFPDALALTEALRRVVPGEQLLEQEVLTSWDAPLNNPYKGLQAFSEADAADFFGRELLTERLVERLLEVMPYQRFLAVVGPSGSGKSSVVRAGLIPALRAGAIPGSEDWYVVVMLPGPRPFDELEIQLMQKASRGDLNLQEQLRRDAYGLLRAVRLALPDGAELLLVIDQFEELFTLVPDQNIARHFMDCLHAAVTEVRSPVRVGITLRADFYDRPLLHPDFAQLIQERTEVVVPLTAEELIAAINKPAERAGVRYEEGLIASLVNEVLDQPGALPLLQYTLTELFKNKDGHLLTHKVYESIGGVAGALSRRAEETFARLTGPQQIAAKQVFLQLVTLDEGANDMRRRVLRSELEALTHAGGSLVEQVDAVLDAFGSARLLSFDRDPQTRGPTVEVAHEALLRKWKRLFEWVDESRVDLRMQHALGNAAKDWAANARDPSFLLRGSRLEQYTGWADSTQLALTEIEQVYLAASRADEEARRTRRAKLEAIGLAGLALNELHGRRPERAVPLALEAIENYPYTWQARRALGMAVLNQRVDLRMSHEGVIKFCTLSKDGKLLLTSCNDGSVHIWDTDSGMEQLGISGLGKPIAIWSPDESGMLIMSGDTNRGWSFQLRNATSGDLLYSHELDSKWTWSIFSPDPWSPDGERFVTSHIDGSARIWNASNGNELLRLSALDSGVQATWSPGGDILLTIGIELPEITCWDATRGEIKYTLTLVPQAPWNTRFGAWSPSGDYFVVRDQGRACIYETASGRKLQELIVPGVWIQFAQFSYDGTQIITCGNEDGIARLWDVQTGEKLGSIGGLTQAEAVAWSPIGGLAAVGGANGMVHIWNTATGIEKNKNPFVAGDIFFINWSPDGKKFFVASSIAAEVWKYKLSLALFNLPGSIGYIGHSGWSPDGLQISTVMPDGTVNVYQVATQEFVFSLDSGKDTGGTSWSSAGDRIVTSNWDGPLKIFTAASGKLLVESSDSSLNLFVARWSPDDHRIAGVIDQSNKVVIWDSNSLDEVLSFSVRGDLATNVTWSPDGTRLATSSINGEAAIRDAASGEVKLQLFPDDCVEQVFGNIWTKDGQQIIVFINGIGHRFDAYTGEELMQYIGHNDVVFTLDLSPDGQLLYTGGADGTARVFDVKSGAELLVYEIGGWVNSSLSPDGTQLLLTSTTGEISVYPVWQTTEELVTYAKTFCVKYELTTEELAQFGLSER